MKRLLYLPILVLLVATCEDAGRITQAPDAEGTALEARAARAAQTTAGVPVFLFSGPMVPGASSKITRNRSGATSTLHTSGLTPGNALTLWMVVFNVPGECATSPCGEADVAPGTDAEVDVIYVAGHVVGGSGKATFSGRRATGDNSKSLFAQFGAPAPGLTDPLGAEMHLIVRDHGPAIPGQIPDQIHTFEGACTPASSFGLGDGGYECEDIQFSIHQP